MFKGFIQDIVMITNETYRNLSVKNYLALGDTIIIFVHDRWFVAEGEVGRGLLKLSTPCPLASQTMSSQISNKDGNSTTSLSSLWQCSVTFRVKTHFLTFRWNFSYFSLSAASFALTRYHHKPVWVFFPPSHQVFIYIDKIHLDLSPGWTVLLLS